MAADSIACKLKMHLSLPEKPVCPAGFYMLRGKLQRTSTEPLASMPQGTGLLSIRDYFRPRNAVIEVTLLASMCLASQTRFRAMSKHVKGRIDREVRMKKEISFFLLLTLFLGLGAVGVSAQEKSYITVTGSQVNNGVVILDVVKAGKAYRLQCNQGAPACTTLGGGKYLMFELPENFGMYECKDVEIYPEPVVNPEKDKDKKLGEYCLVQK
jgi:hypothetical protein